MATGAAFVLGILMIQTSSAGDEPIEEIEIIGQRSLFALRNDVIEAEVSTFELFNALNDQSMFRVTCGPVIITGSKIPGRECVPAYIKRARNRSATDFVLLGTLQKTEEEIWLENRVNHARFNAKMREVAGKAPELAAALNDLQVKRQRLQQAESRQK